MSGTEKTVIIALGSRFRGDDGVGPVVADQLRSDLRGCRIIEGCEDAMTIVSTWEDADLAVIVDAASSGMTPGTIHRLEVDAAPLPKDLARCSSHGLGLAEAVELGRALGRLPGRLVIYGVEAEAFEPGATLSGPVSGAVPEIVRQICAEAAPHASA